MVNIGSVMGGMSFQEAWSETQSRLDSGSSTESGSKRIQREIYKDFVRIDEPCTLIGTKEATAPAVFNGRSDLQTVRPNRRSRQILSYKARLYHKNKSLVDSIPYDQIDMDNLHMKRPGLWVERRVLQETLRIGFSVPRLGIPTSLFDGRIGNYTSDALYSLYEFEQDGNLGIDNINFYLTDLPA
jgi:hypothetical protein